MASDTPGPSISTCSTSEVETFSPFQRKGGALLEDVGQDLLLRGGLVSIAREVVADVVADLADGFADLADAGQAAQAVRAADRLFAVHGELDQADIDLFLQ